MTVSEHCGYSCSTKYHTHCYLVASINNSGKTQQIVPAAQIQLTKNVFSNYFGFKKNTENKRDNCLQMKTRKLSSNED